MQPVSTNSILTPIRPVGLLKSSIAALTVRQFWMLETSEGNSGDSIICGPVSISANGTGLWIHDDLGRAQALGDCGPTARLP